MFSFKITLKKNRKRSDIHFFLRESLSGILKKKIPHQKVYVVELEDRFLVKASPGKAEIVVREDCVDVEFELPILYRPLRKSIIRASKDVLEEVV